MSLFKNLLALILCSMGALATEAGELETLDASALEAYRAQNYELAEQQWTRALELETVRASSAERGRILHNLGNTALRSDDALDAVALYSASLKLRPRNAATLANLDFARTEAGLDPASRASFFGSLTLAEMERLVLFLAFALFLMLLGEAFLGGAFKPAAIVTGLLLLGSLIPWGWQLADAQVESVMVVKRAGTSLRSEPRVGATTLIRLKPGTEHVSRDELPNWIAVETSEGLEGWVKAADLLQTTY